MAHRDTPSSSSPFVNPADVRNRALASDNYIWQNARKLSFHIDEPVREYFITLRLVIARDGRLLSADVAQSSGRPSIDQAILAGARRNSPYLPCRPRSAETAQPSSCRSRRSGRGSDDRRGGR
jgi:protein TonB